MFVILVMWAKTLDGVAQNGKKVRLQKKLPRIQLCNMSLIDFLSNYMLQHKSRNPKPSHIVFSYTCIILCNGNVNHTNGSWGLGFNTSFFRVKCDFQAKKLSIFSNKFFTIKKHGGQACNETAILLKEVNIFKIGMQKFLKKKLN